MRKNSMLQVEALEQRTLLSASLPVALEAEVAPAPMKVAPTQPAEAQADRLTESPLSGQRLGDFNKDGLIDAADIDLLCANLGNHSESGYDITQDGAVDMLDMNMLVRDVIGTEYGDANLDGHIDIWDLRMMYRNLFSPAEGWASGDFSCDGFVDGNDFILWNQNKFLPTTLAAALAAGNSVPSSISGIDDPLSGQAATHTSQSPQSEVEDQDALAPAAASPVKVDLATSSTTTSSINLTTRQLADAEVNEDSQVTETSPGSTSIAATEQLHTPLTSDPAFDDEPVAQQESVSTETSTDVAQKAAEIRERFFALRRKGS